MQTSASDPDEFSRFQDLLTFFIKYENRHELRNVLAMMNPVSCQVTQVIATNVFLENDDYGQETGRLKRPVLMEGSELTVRHHQLMINCGTRVANFFSIIRQLRMPTSKIKLPKFDCCTKRAMLS